MTSSNPGTAPTLDPSSDGGVESVPRTAAQLAFASLGTPLVDTTFVVIDLETTGLSPRADRITEIGAVKVRGGEVLGELRTFVHPGCPIPPGITAVTGITDAMVRDAPTLVTVLPLVLGFLADAVLVAHNAPFDVGFLRHSAERHGFDRFEPVVVDTARLARRLLRSELRDCRLETVARHLRSRTAPRHRALADARATVDVLHGLIERAGSYGAVTVEDLRDLERSTSDRTYRRISLVRGAPDTCGVYRFLDPRGEVLYVGKATNLRTLLRTYFGQDRRRRTADLVRETERVTWEPLPTLVEAEVQELRLIRRHRPRYNRRSNRSSAPVHVALTKEPFPRLSVVRRPGAAHLRTFGPFPSRRVAEHLVEALQAGTSIRPCTARLRASQDHRACILAELGRCGAPCDGSQSRDAYAGVVAGVEAILDDPSPLLEGLRGQMTERARQGRYEQAREARTRLHATARAMFDVRETTGLAAVDELIVAHEGRDRVEVVVVRRGRLLGSSCLPAPASDREVLAAVDHAGWTQPLAEEPPEIEELRLLLGWLRGPDRRLVRALPSYAVPWAGGGELTRTVEEARHLARELRRDRQLLDGSKTTRRSRREEGVRTGT